MSRDIDWLQVGAGVALIAATTFDVIPGDELIGIPSGAYFILRGLKVL